jgi:hypothetical protein
MATGENSVLTVLRRLRGNLGAAKVRVCRAEAASSWRNRMSEKLSPDARQASLANLSALREALNVTKPGTKQFEELERLYKKAELGFYRDS